MCVTQTNQRKKMAHSNQTNITEYRTKRQILWHYDNTEVDKNMITQLLILTNHLVFLSLLWVWFWAKNQQPNIKTQLAYCCFWFK